MSDKPIDNRDLPTGEQSEIYAAVRLVRHGGKWYDDEGNEWEPGEFAWAGWFPRSPRRDGEYEIVRLQHGTAPMDGTRIAKGARDPEAEAAARKMIDELRRKHSCGEVYTLSRIAVSRVLDHMLALEREVEDWKAGAQVEGQEADRGRARISELESGPGPEAVAALSLLRDHLRQECGRAAHQEVDGESPGPVEFAIDLLNEKSARVAEIADRMAIEDSPERVSVRIWDRVVEARKDPHLMRHASDVATDRAWRELGRHIADHIRRVYRDGMARSRFDG